MNYRELLRDPRWQRKRLEVLRAKHFKCESCNETTKPLHVHHRYYVSHRFPWEYPDFCFQVLCEECHEALALNLDCDRAHGETVFSEWEEGLNFFGENIHPLMTDAHEFGVDDVKLYAKEISWLERREKSRA